MACSAKKQLEVFEGQERPRGLPRAIRKVDGRWFGDARVNIAGVEVKFIYFCINDHVGHFAWPGETHPFHELFWTISGHGYIHCDGRTESCRAGHLFMARAGVEHRSSWNTEEEAPWRGLIFQFDLGFDEKELKMERDLSPSWGVAPFIDYFLVRKNNSVVLDVQTHNNLKHSADDLARQLKSFPRFGSALITSFWLRLMALVSQYLLGARKASLQGVVEDRSRKEMAMLKAKKMLEDIDRSRVDIGAVARAVGMSKFHFIRAFHRWFGVPPERFSRQTVMEHAGRLLVQTDLPVNDIASKFGFSDSSNFSKAFRRHAKIGPYEFRQRGQHHVAI